MNLREGRRAAESALTQQALRTKTIQTTDRPRHQPAPPCTSDDLTGQTSQLFLQDEPDRYVLIPTQLSPPSLILSACRFFSRRLSHLFPSVPFPRPSDPPIEDRDLSLSAEGCLTLLPLLLLLLEPKLK